MEKYNKMKKSTGFQLIFIIFASIKTISAYIDPGAGGYLATSIFSAILTYIAIAVAATGFFFSVHFIKPIKKLIKNHKKTILWTMLILTIIFFVIFFIPYKNKFNSTLSGTHIYNESKISPSYFLYEGKLIDIDGEQIHDWNNIYLGVIDKNGDYYAQEYYESQKWGRYTWNDSVVWELNFPIHHEIVLTPEDTIITFTKETHNYNQRKVEFDVILELDKDGNILNKWSTWENLNYLKQFHKQLELEQPPTFLIPEEHKKEESIWGGNYDYYHLNSLSIVPNNSLQWAHPAFTPGNWIISFRHGSMIFILDKDTKQVLWRAIDKQIQGNLEGPHTPMMTSEGNIIVMDNGRYRGWSRIISINPIDLSITWEYKAEPPEEFFSLSQSSIQLLPNYNVLITESEKGHVFEITPEKELVWEFYNPDKQNETNSANKEKYGLRKEIYRMISYDKTFIDNLIKENEK